MSSRDLFANFDRLRREMDELFGAGLPARQAGHWPAVDVVYAADPPRAVVTAEIAGVDSSDIALQIEGRHLIIAGRRGAPSPAGEVYQQLEIARGTFRRVIELGAEVRSELATARYTDGMLSVELPLQTRSPRSRAVPIESADPGVIHPA